MNERLALYQLRLVLDPLGPVNQRPNVRDDAEDKLEFQEDLLASHWGIQLEVPGQHFRLALDWQAIPVHGAVHVVKHQPEIVIGGHRLAFPASNKKADVEEHPKVSHHVGLLSNEPPGAAGLPFI
jgi:hypothetical protein